MAARTRSYCRATTSAPTAGTARGGRCGRRLAAHPPTTDGLPPPVETPDVGVSPHLESPPVWGKSRSSDSRPGPCSPQCNMGRTATPNGRLVSAGAPQTTICMLHAGGRRRATTSSDRSRRRGCPLDFPSSWARQRAELLKTYRIGVIGPFAGFVPEGRERGHTLRNDPGMGRIAPGGIVILRGEIVVDAGVVVD